MVRRRLSFWTFYFDSIAGSRLGDAGDLDLGQIERCPTGGKASRESAAARRRTATISDGLICSSTQTASIALLFWTPFLSRPSPGEIRLELRSDNSRRGA